MEGRDHGGVATSPTAEEHWISGQDVGLADLLYSPENVMRNVALRRRSARTEVGHMLLDGDNDAPHSSPEVRAPLKLRTPETLNERVRAYRLYVVRNVGVMTPLIYALILGRSWLSSHVHHGGLGEVASTRDRLLATCYTVSWAFMLTALVVASSLLIIPSVWRKRRVSAFPTSADGPSDKLLLRMILADCALGPHHVFSIMEYLAKPEVECPPNVAFSLCLLKVYWPTTHIGFLCKWTATGYPPRVVFAPELFRTVFFIAAAIAAVALQDGWAEALKPAFVTALVLKSFTSFALALLAVTITTAPLHATVIEAALPAGLLDASCPRPLRKLRDAVCAASFAFCAALHLHQLGGVRGFAGYDATSFEAFMRGAYFTNVAALSIVVNIINGDISLHSIGRMESWLTLVFMVFMLFSPQESVLDPSSLPADAAADSDLGERELQQLQLSWEDVERGEVLGAGTFGTVIAARWKGTDVAIKLWVPTPHDSSDDQSETRLLSEAELLMQLRHPNILQFFGVLPPPRAIVMERGSRTLSSLLVEQPWLPWSRCLELLQGVVAGAEFLHSYTPPIIHGDLKTSNILISVAGTPKIADFGTSFVIKAAAATHEVDFRIFSIGFAPPEVLLRKAISLPKAVDVFAFGVIVTCVVGGTKAAAHHSGKLGTRGTRSTGSVPSFLLCFQDVYISASYKPFLLPDCPEPLKAVVFSCCSQSPQDRPSFTVLRHMLRDAAERVAEWPDRPTSA